MFFFFCKRSIARFKLYKHVAFLRKYTMKRIQYKIRKLFKHDLIKYFPCSSRWIIFIAIKPNSSLLAMTQMLIKFKNSGVIFENIKILLYNFLQ